MIWGFLVVVALVVMAPVLWFAWRGGRLRGRHESALALHRAQLIELDRDLAAGRLLAEEHAGAVLEVQRRLLADAALREPDARRSGGVAIGVMAVGVPLAALALYVVTAGHPGPPPPAPPPPVEAPANVPDPAEDAREDELIGQLRNRLALMDAHAPRTLQGYEILGNAELRRGHLLEAAAAFRHVLNDHFDPTLAAETAEVLTEAAGRMTPEATALFRRALAEAPADAPWRKMVEKRLAAPGGS